MDGFTTPTSPKRPPSDGWLGTLELPGYRAGPVVARLDELPGVDPDHLYFDLLLLDGSGRTEDYHSGACRALARRQSIDQRSRFVRLAAELVRHAAGEDRDLPALGQALTFIRERGVETERLITAAQLLDNMCSEHAVAASLQHLLELSLGAEEAALAMCDVVKDLARRVGTETADIQRQARAINAGGLPEQVSYVVRTVGKARARHYLREVTDFELVPRPDMFGL